MPLPIDLILVRHGESEGNFANRLDRAGKGEQVEKAHWDRHSSELRLTDRGIEQAKSAGSWLKEHFKGFDYCVCSDYARAKETAAYLDLPGEGWSIDPYLVERYSGEFEDLRHQEKISRFGPDYVRNTVNHFYKRPPNGESRLDIGLRWDRIMLSLSQRHANDRTVIVAHATIIESGLIRRLHWTIEEFYEWKRKEDPETKVHNCQIIHFTRRNPETDQITEKIRWWRTVCPWDLSKTNEKWRTITPRRFSKEDLLKQVEIYPRIITSDSSGKSEKNGRQS